MGEIERIEQQLDAAGVPKEVWIGIDSTADRVTWLITRNALNQQNSRTRFKAMNELADLVQIALAGGAIDKDFRVKADEALVAAGRIQP